MAEELIVLTDPARELADLLTALQGGSTHLQGDQYLASQFGVEAWSHEFHRIIAIIIDRMAQLRAVIGDLPLDNDIQLEMVGHVDDAAGAFVLNGFGAAWQSHGLKRVGATNVQPIKGLSGLVRQRLSYRRLSDNDVADLISDVNELLAWLREHQLAEQDFIRQALIEGLEQMRFRLEHFRWLGWGYTVQSLRDVIGAYMMLERQQPTAQNNPDAGAMLAKVGAFLKAAYEKTQSAKGVFETGKFLAEVYAGSIIIGTHVPGISGLLASS